MTDRHFQHLSNICPILDIGYWILDIEYWILGGHFDTKTSLLGGLVAEIWSVDEYNNRVLQTDIWTYRAAEQLIILLLLILLVRSISQDNII